MQKDALKKQLGKYVRLRPIAERTEGGQRLPDIDDYWQILRVLDGGIELMNSRTTHHVVLNFDHIHHFTSDNKKYQGTECGFLELNMRVIVYPRNTSVEPIDFRRNPPNR